MGPTDCWTGAILRLEGLCRSGGAYSNWCSNFYVADERGAEVDAPQKAMGVETRH